MIMIKRIYYLFLIFNILFAFNVSIIKAEETEEDVENGNTVCKYRYDADRNIEVIYNDSTYSVNLTDSLGNVLTLDEFNGPVDTVGLSIENNFTYDEWMEYVNRSESESSCPYSLVLSKYMNILPSGYDVKYRLQLHESGFFAGINWHDSDLFCINCSDVEFDFGYNSTEFECSSLLGERTISIINEIMDYIKVLIPVGLIAFGIFDFTRAMFASSEEDMKKIQKLFVRRIIIAVLIFLSPIFVNIAINITNDISGFVRTDTCGIL